MGIAFYRIKIGLYVFVIILVGILFGARVYNTFQKTTYLTTPIFKDNNAQISLSHPIRILSPRNESSYPLTLAFARNNDALSSSRTYTVTLESPTLLFLDAQGTEITPHFQFTDSGNSAEQSVYVRPYLSEFYPQRHVITTQVIEKQAAIIYSSSIEIQTEPGWLSVLILAASSLLEISIASALVTWTVNALDTALTSRKERVTGKKDKLNGLATLPYLERLERFISLEAEIKKENIAKDLRDELQHWQMFFFASENEFVQTVGTLLRQDDQAGDFANIHKCYVRFFTVHKDSVNALTKILSPLTIKQEHALSLIETIVKLWEDFDVDSKDLIAGALKRLSKKVDLSKISDKELWETIFNTPNRRRLLRGAEIRMLFPQLSPFPVGYDVKWQPQKHTNEPTILNWLKKFDLVSNPFGASDLNIAPFYPNGFLPPNQWNDFLKPLPQHAQCPATEDAKALSFHLRAECLPTKKRDEKGNETTDSGKQIFPVLVSFNHSATIEAPLLTIVRSAAQTWLEILCLSPDAMLDLLPAEQETLLELLCWAYGSNKTVKNFLQREVLKPDKSGSLLMQKVDQFQSGVSSTQIPQNITLLSWLKIRPPDLNPTYLIIPLDEIPTATKGWWLEQFSPLISTLFLNEVVTKAISALDRSTVLPLSVIQLDWTEKKLKMSLNLQFEAAMDKTIQKDMGQVVDFRSLFGSDPAIGYFATEEETTERLITASNKSLARLLALGNRLFQHYCEHRKKDEVPEKYLYVEDLETILKTA